MIFPEEPLFKCPRCAETKPESQFSVSRGTGKRVRPRKCKSCRNASDREKHQRWAEANPEKAKNRFREYEVRHNEVRKARWHEDPEYREQNRQAAARYRVKHREKVLAQHKDRHRFVKSEVISRYGGRCECCGESRIEFLSIDHVNGDGSLDRKANGGSYGVYRKLLNSIDRLDGYRLLCMNCNCSIGFYGYCPHTIADPTDSLSMDVVGFDTAAPQVITDFSAGRI